MRRFAGGMAGIKLAAFVTLGYLIVILLRAETEYNRSRPA